NRDDARRHPRRPCDPHRRSREGDRRPGRGPARPGRPPTVRGVMARKTKQRKPESGDVATNRRARHKFQVLERMEAGIELRGSEVKSLRDGKASLNEAYAVVNEG